MDVQDRYGTFEHLSDLQPQADPHHLDAGRGTAGENIVGSFQAVGLAVRQRQNDLARLAAGQ